MHIASENDKHIDDIYVELIEEYYLTKNYGKKLPDELKYLKRGGAESVRLNEGELVNNLNHKENRLSFRGWLRETCHDHGVTKEHISEYVCDIGRYYSMDCPCASNSTFSEKPMGLRCDQPKGCTCGNSRCPQYAFCDDGYCKYDLFYQHRVCPGPDWDPNKSDSENYVSFVGEKLCYIYYEVMLDANIEDIKKSGDYKAPGIYDDFEYDDCYWEFYNRELMTRKDPCVQESDPNK